MKTEIVRLDRNQMAAVTAQNLIEAGELEPEDFTQYVQVLEQMPLEKALQALVESHQIREQTGLRVRFYPLDMRRIGKN